MQTGGQQEAAAAIKAQRALAVRRRAPRVRPAEQVVEEEPQVAIVLGFEALAPDAVAVDRPEAIDAALLARVQPKKVICPMIGEDYDALIVATHLRGLNFEGTLVVVAPELPNPRMVEREIRNQAGGLRVSVVIKP